MNIDEKTEKRLYEEGKSDDYILGYERGEYDTKQKLKSELETYKKIVDEIKELRDTIQKEYEYAMEGFTKKQLATSVVDGTIAQETGWILNKIDEILNIG